MSATVLPVSVFWSVRRVDPSGITRPDLESAEWPSDFLVFTSASTPDEKLAVPAFLPGLFAEGQGRTRGDTKRGLAKMTALVLDYDDGATMEAVDAVVGDLERVLYTTFRHTPERHRFRVILPLSAPISPTEYERLQAAYHAHLKARGVPVAPLNVAQCYFLATSRPGVPHRAWHRAGVRLDPSPWLAAPAAPAAAIPRPAIRASAPPPAAPSTGGIFAGIEDAGLERLDRIEERCAFMRHARESAASLDEPQWRAWLSVLAKCKDGRAHAHAIGSAHPTYSREGTEAKLARLTTEISGPMTCQEIRKISPACEGCPLGAPIGATSTPVQLGRPDPATTPPAEYAADVSARGEATLAAARDEHAAAVADLEAATRAASEAKERRAHARRFAISPDAAIAAAADVQAAQRAIETAKSRLTRATKRLAAAERDHDRATQTAANGGSLNVAQQLAVGPSGVPYGSRSNIETILNFDPAFSDIRYDGFGEKILYGDIEAGDADAERASDIERRYAIPEVRLQVYREALVTVARRREFHPVRDYLDGLRWDGVQRLEKLMSDGFGAKTGDPRYLALVGVKLCLSAVGRVYEPGCKVDEVVILTGREGARKSTGLRALAGQWFSDAHVDMKSKDGIMAIAGVFIYELGELDSVQRAEMSTVKRFISTQTDRYRPPYAANMKDRPRQNILVGTTNEEEFLGRDGHGDRRFVPVKTDAVNVEWIEDYRDLLWGEAKARYDAGERWHYAAEDYALLADAQDAHRMEHPWTSLIRRWLYSGHREHPDWCDPREALMHEECIAKPAHQIKHYDLIEVGKVLRALGCTRYHPPPENGKRPPRGYHVPEEYRARPGSGKGPFGGLPATAPGAAPAAKTSTGGGQILAYPAVINYPTEPPF
jgi:hypothetical protein